MFADHNDLPLFLHWFSDDSLSILDNFIIWLNFFGAVYACYWSTKATHTALLKSDRITMARVAALTWVFIIAYIVLLVLDNVQQAEWAAVMRGVSIPVWVFVWAFPARAIAKQNILIGQKVEEEIQKRLEYNIEHLED